MFLVLIHYDVHEMNLIVNKSQGDNWEIVGIIDFEDTTYGYKVYDIGNYIMYMMSIADNSMDIGGYCLQGFMQNCKLSQDELDLLYYCVCARFVVSLVMGLYYYSITKDPYILVSQRGWGVFKKLWSLPAQEVLAHWTSEKFQKYNF